jgi:O-antigen ligase
MTVFDIVLKSQFMHQICAAVALGTLLGLISLVSSPTLVLGGIMGLALLMAAFTNPEIVILVVLCFTSGFIPSRFNPFIRLPVGSFQVSDLLLVWLLFMVVFRVFTDKNFPYVKTPLDVPVLSFYGAVVLGLGTAVFRFGINFSHATYEARMLIYYLIFFAVTNLIRTRSQLVRLVRGVLSIGLLVAGTMVIQAILGRSVSLMDDSALQGRGLIRFFYPGYTVSYIVLTTLICDMALRKHPPYPLLRALRVLVLGIGLLITLGRNILASGAISCVVLIFILRKAQRSRLVLNVLLVAFITLGFVGMLAISGRGALILEYSAAYLGRLSRMFSAEIVAPEETLVPRWVEMQYAWAQLVKHPILGIGLHNPYRPPFYEGDPLRHYIHNAYLSIWLKTGLVGLASFLWFSVHFLWRGFQRWRDVQDDFLRAVSLGFTLAYLGMMLSNLVAPTFVEGWSLAIFGVILGINESILHNEAADEYKKEGGLHDVQHTTAPG